MRRLKTIYRGGLSALTAAACWLAVQGVLLAQVMKDGMVQSSPAPNMGTTGEGGSYVLPYVIVLVFVGLGVMFVCRSSRRRDRARPEEYAAVFKNEGEEEPAPEE